MLLIVKKLYYTLIPLNSKGKTIGVGGGKHKKTKPEFEFNESEPRLKSVKETVSIERRLKS